MSNNEECNCDQALDLKQRIMQLEEEISFLEEEISASKDTSPIHDEDELQKAFMAGVGATGNSYHAWLNYRLDIKHLIKE